MAAPATTEPRTPKPAPTAAHEPYVPDSSTMPEFTWPAVLVGAVLGIIFGASSLYLVLKVGLTVSASIPVAVLSITLFRLFSRMFGIRRATILENNIVQTTGSAGESVAFGVGVTIPALMLLGMDMELTRVMTVGVLGGLLGILMMIPLRKAFIVKQHGTLKYPEGTACADVLIVGEEGGATAATVFTGFGLAFVHKFVMSALHLWKDEVNRPLVTSTGRGLRGGILGGELTPELLGVGYIIGPRIASIMLAGGVLAYLVLIPLIVMFVNPASLPADPTSPAFQEAIGEFRAKYILYIGAGAVAAGGIISMFQALPMIISSLRAGLRDLNPAGGKSSASEQRTDRDLPIAVVILGAAVLVLAMAAIPSLGLGVSARGLTGAGLIVLFGFLFVTVSSRLTGEIGSSSNPISGMTVATLLLTCLVFLAMNQTGPAATLTAMTVAAIVCIAASNGGTTSQDLKTGYLVGATPRLQQIAILIGSLTSALVIGAILLMLNNAGTVWTETFLATSCRTFRKSRTKRSPAGSTPVTHANTSSGTPPRGKSPACRRANTWPMIVGNWCTWSTRASTGALKSATTALKFAINSRRQNAFDGLDHRRHLKATAAVGIGLHRGVDRRDARVGRRAIAPLRGGSLFANSNVRPHFCRRCDALDCRQNHAPKDAEADMSPGVLLSSGYIAGGAIAGVIVAFFGFATTWLDAISLSRFLPKGWNESNWPALGAFAVLLVVLAFTGFGLLFRGARPAPAKPAKSR